MPLISLTKRRLRRTAAFGIVVALALALRVAALPARGDVRDMDEIGYAMGGLVLWEGMAPGYQFAPAGAVTWIGWLRAASASARAAVEERGRPIHLIPFNAVGHALSAEHEDLRSLRLALLAFGVAAGTAGALAAAVLGARLAGLAGLAGAGLAAASLPLFVEHAVMTKPYADAWAAGLVAAALATSRRPRVAAAGSGITLGMAAASRIDMMLLAPVVIALREARSPSPPARSHVHWAGAAALSFLACSPWFVTGLLGNLRTIVAVRFYSAALVQADSLGVAREMAGRQGLAAIVVLVLAGCASAVRRPGTARVRLARAALAAWLVALLASALLGTAYGMRHQGGVVVALVAAFGPALRECSRVAGRRGARVAALLACAAPVALGAAASWDLRAASTPSDAAAWIEANVAPGTPVYVPLTEERPPLPTPACGMRLWREVADPEAWRAKVRRQMARHGLPDAALPSALSEAHLVQERSFRRRWALLAESRAARPRYDVRPWSDASAFDIRSSELVAAVRASGGVVVDRGAPIPELEPPAAAWLSAAGTGCRVYVVPRGAVIRAEHEPSPP